VGQTVGETASDLVTSCAGLEGSAGSEGSTSVRDAAPIRGQGAGDGKASVGSAMSDPQPSVTLRSWVAQVPRYSVEAQHSDNTWHVPIPKVGSEPQGWLCIRSTGDGWRDRPASTPLPTSAADVTAELSIPAKHGRDAGQDLV